MYSDIRREFPILAIAGTILVGALISGLTNAVIAGFSGEDMSAAFLSGAFSGAIMTTGMCLAIATGGWGGLLVAGLSGGLSGGGNYIYQGKTKGWNNIDGNEIFISAGIGAVFAMGTYGLLYPAAIHSSGGLKTTTDVTTSWTTRATSALSISPESFVAALMIDLPVTVTNVLTSSIYPNNNWDTDKQKSRNRIDVYPMGSR